LYVLVNVFGEEYSAHPTKQEAKHVNDRDWKGFLDVMFIPLMED